MRFSVSGQRRHRANIESPSLIIIDADFVGFAQPDHILDGGKQAHHVHVPVNAGQRQVDLQALLGQGLVGRSVEMLEVHALVGHQHRKIQALLHALQVAGELRKLVRLGLHFVIDGQQFFVG